MIFNSHSVTYKYSFFVKCFLSMEADPIKITLLGETRCFSNFNLSSVCSNTDTESTSENSCLGLTEDLCFSKIDSLLNWHE